MLIALHLLPGLLIAGFYFVLANVFVQVGLSGYLALILSIPICLVPIELGVMVLWAVRFTGSRSILAVVDYQRKGTTADYIALPLFLFACLAAVSVAMQPISQYLETQWTDWLPAWATQEALISGLAGIPPAQRSITFALAALLSGVVAPVVEELYFRGFLLPKMGQLGWVAPVVNSFLFAIYHFYFPENVPGIFVAFLPISYVAMFKRNWRIGAIVHIMSNLYGVISLALLS